MTVFILVVVLFFKDANPISLAMVYPDRFQCETKMGLVATAADKDDKIVSWTIPVSCKSVEQPVKA